MSGVRARKKRETRSAILAAAIRLFGEKGFEGTSIGELARAAGIGKGTVYGYFRTKQEVFLAFCEEEIDFALAAAAEKAESGACLLDQLLTLFMSQFVFVTGNREFGRHFIREMAFPKSLPSAESRAVDARYLAAVGDLLERAKQSGELGAEADPFLTTVHFYALYLVALSGWYTGYVNTYPEVEENLRTLFRQALEGLAVNRVERTAVLEGNR